MVIYSKLVINSVEYTSAEKINIIGAIGASNSSGRFNISFLNTCGVYSNTFAVGNVVEISLKKDSDSFVDGDKILVGLVEDISFKGMNNNTETIVLTGTDYTSKLMNVTVKPIVYNNIDIANIVINIISDNVPEITTTNVVTTGKIKGQINFNHTPIFDAIKGLAEEVGYLFYIDKDLDLHFEPKGSVSSGVTLDTTDSTATVQILSSQFKVTNNGDFANAIWVYGDRQLTGWSNSFTANGGSVYTLDYKPSNTKVYVAGSTTPKVGGVYELTQGNVGSPIQYLVNYDAKQIIFVSGTSAGNNIPSSGATNFKVDYDRNIPIIRFGQDNASVNAYRKKEKIIVDKNITNPTTATDRLVTELKNKSSPIVDGTLAVHGIANLPAGQTIVINHPYHNIIYQTYDILETNYNITKQTLQNENIITLRLNKRLIELTDTIKNLMLSVKELQAKDSVESGDVYPRLQFATGSFGFRVKEWKVLTREIGNAFVLGHPQNGVLGSPAIGVGGSQVTIGSLDYGSLILIRSGGEI